MVSSLEGSVFNDCPRESLAPRVEKLYRIADLQGNPRLRSRAKYWDAYRLAIVHTDSAERLLSDAWALTHDAYDRCRLDLLRADLARMRGRWAEAYALYSTRLVELEEMADSFWVAKTNVAIGAIWQALGGVDKALEHYLYGDSLFKAMDCRVCLIRNRINISNMRYLKDERGEALEILRNLRVDPVARADTAYMVNVLISAYRVSDRGDHAAAREAYRLVGALDDPYLKILTTHVMGDCLANEHKADSAITYYRRALAMSDGVDSRYNLAAIFHGMSEAFAAKGETDSAYKYLREYDGCRDRELAQDRILGMSKLENRATMERFGAELFRLREEKRLQRQIAWVAFGGGMMIFALICWLLWMGRRKARAEKRLLEAENRQQAMVNDSIRDELDSRTRELTSIALEMSPRNALLKDVAGRMSELVRTGKLPEDEGNAMIRKVESLLSSDGEWQNFKIHFEQVHPDFFTRLKERFPDLSKNELRLCAYIRLNMSAKEIAQVLSVRADTVNTSRYRLRKKIGLPPGTSLDSFIMDL